MPWPNLAIACPPGRERSAALRGSSLREERSEGGPGAFQISLAGCLTAPG
jgi:hypothetical protein